MEKLYHYIWKSGLAGREFKDVDGHNIEVLDPGNHNNDSGPDFFNTKLRIDGTEWVGNVEIHVKASDWFRHGHDTDPAYENVILHVVGISDKRIPRKDGSMLNQAELTFPENFFRIISRLSENIDSVKCGNLLESIPDLNRTDWVESLTVERLQQKAAKVIEINDLTGGDWEQTCFILLSRGLGFGLNGEPFELLARSLPLRILHHHSDNIFQLEAILFGQAAMLDSSLHIFDEYFQGLCREYYFLAKKYGLRPQRPGLWKYSKTRPHNFPHRRIAYLAAAAKDGFSMFSKILESKKNSDSLTELFNIKIEGYWSRHFSFDTSTAPAPTELSLTSRELLVINVAVPLLYAYAGRSGDIELGEKALGLMEELPPENNALIRGWKALGFKCRDAAETQALLHLRKEYCDKNKCLYCRFGHHMLRKAVLS